MNRTRNRRIAAFALVILLPFGGQLFSRPLPYDEGAVGLAFALRKLPVTGSFLQTAAHPDDEDNPLLVLLGQGRGLRTGLLTLTRGEGGQNEIGPELFEALGIIRTEELMAMHQYDGAEQFFSHAYEFGYSFSVEETLQKWGKQEILAEMVRVIRKFRPDVIVSMSRAGRGGGQHHQASALLTEEAFRAAADPDRFPEQIDEGLRPWQAGKLYERSGRSGSEAREGTRRDGLVTMETGGYDPLYGRTYAEIGMEGRSKHRCQGMDQLIPLPGPHSSSWRLVDASIPMAPDEEDLFAGIDTSLFAIEERAGANSDRVPFLHADLRRIQQTIDEALSAYDALDPGRTAVPLAVGLNAVRRLREKIEKSDLAPEARYDITFLLERKEKDFSEALRLARQVSVEALVDDGTVVAGQVFRLSVTIFNGGPDPLQLSGIKVRLPAGWELTELPEKATEISPRGALTQSYGLRVASHAEPTRPYWIRKDLSVDRYEIQKEFVNAPWADPVLSIDVSYATEGVLASIHRIAEYRYTGPWVGGEQRQDLMVVPAVSLRVDPAISILPLDSAAEGRRVRVTALYDGLAELSGTVSFQPPPGWKVEPAQQTYHFTRSGQSLTKIFVLRPPLDVSEGRYEISARGSFGGRTFSEGYQVIDYDHIRRRHLFHPSTIEVKAVDVKVAPDLKVGYVMGVGDQVPEALEQLGVDFEFLDPDDLAFADLGAFNVIITGVRAYLGREDLKAYNSRLLDWVREGGTLIVQYNKFEFNDEGRGDSPYAPFPARIGRGRVTDENAPVDILVPNDPVFLSPNRITDRDWGHWVQERGLYFLGAKSREYRDLISTADPFEYNSGPQLGALVEADYGRGRWIYVGLGLWRQLPAGVPGAYRILANLLSLGADGGSARRR